MTNFSNLIDSTCIDIHLTMLHKVIIAIKTNYIELIQQKRVEKLKLLEWKKRTLEIKMIPQNS
jgi:hypothetical protein